MDADFKDEEDNRILITKVRERGSSIFKKCKICSKESINLKECDYCKWYFCEVHLKPKLIDDMSNKNVGHLCTPYTEKQDVENLPDESLLKD